MSKKDVRIPFAAILAVLIALGALVFALLPEYVRHATGSTFVWFGRVGIPWLLFQAWVIVALVGVFILPAVVARYIKLAVSSQEYSEGQNVTIWVISSIVIGIIWLIAPTYLIVPGGWYYDIIALLAGYSFEKAHILSAVYALVAAGLWFGLSGDDGHIDSF